MNYLYHQFLRIQHTFFDKIFAYSDLSYFDGGVFKKLGFEFSHNTEPFYCYYDCNFSKNSKFDYRKIVMSEDCCTYANTEIHKTHNNSYIRVYDSGNRLYVFKNK